MIRESLRNAFRRLIGIKVCPACGELALNLQYDNPVSFDASNPLFVRWACHACHSCTAWEFYGTMRDVALTLGYHDAPALWRSLKVGHHRHNHLGNNRGGPL